MTTLTTHTHASIDDVHTFLEASTGTRKPIEDDDRVLWAMSPAQRVATMRRGELSSPQLCAWVTRAPYEVPRRGGVPEWLAATPSHELFRSL